MRIFITYVFWTGGVAQLKCGGRFFTQYNAAIDLSF